MAGDVYSKTHKRISELQKFIEAEGIDPLSSLMTPSGASRWALPADSIEGEVDNTLKIPCDRVSFLSQDGKVLARNLPSYLSYEGDVDEYDPTVIPGDIDRVYMEEDGNIVTFYRWVQDEPYDPNDPHGEYVPIANSLKVVDGEGTKVVDSPSTGSPLHERKVNVAIGAPVQNQGNPILISDHTLRHSLSGATPGTYPIYNSMTPPFGYKFRLPTFTVTDIGHVTSIDDNTEVKFPGVLAETSTAGVVAIGRDSDIQSIASVNYAGTMNSRVAASDHVHTSSKFTFSNIAGADVYALYQGLSLDFKNILQATLPGTPGGSGLILGANVSGGSKVADWKTLSACFAAHTVTMSPDNNWTLVNNASQQVWVIGTQNNPLYEQCLYAVDLQFSIKVSAPLTTGSAGPLPDVRSVTVTAGDMVRTFNVDASRAYDMPIPISLSGIVHTAAMQTNVGVSISSDNFIFSVKLDRGVAALLYRNVPTGN